LIPVSIVLFRVDERLVHGQVTVGWGMRLRPALYVAVDDALADSDWEQELFRLGVPAEAGAEFVGVDEARGRLQEWEAAPGPVILLTRDLGHMVRLARDRAMEGREVNLGGIHHGPGRERILPYLFLSAEDRGRILELQEEGVRVMAQDLPDAPRTRAETLLG
jgi:mannose/fructose/N-acetylgalactosamine-specific phosphotransferase system component IIB